MSEQTAYGAVDSQVIKGTLAWLKTVLGDNVELDELPSGEIGFMQQTQPSEPMVKEYKNGSKLLKYDFAVYARVTTSDTQKKLDATNELLKIEQALKEKDYPNIGYPIWKWQMLLFPNRIAAGDDGSDDYQALFRLIYYVERRKD